MHVHSLSANPEPSLTRSQACSPGYYGSLCQKVCDCTTGCACDGGPYGTGACLCGSMEATYLSPQPTAVATGMHQHPLLCSQH